MVIPGLTFVMAGLTRHLRDAEEIPGLARDDVVQHDVVRDDVQKNKVTQGDDFELGGRDPAGEHNRLSGKSIASDYCVTVTVQ